ncbi:MAG: hypothetical protein JXA93_12090 [Anaerolineae bacterium]|nr:hypothetical protein [Anaerolineae bacterium]
MVEETVETTAEGAESVPEAVETVETRVSFREHPLFVEVERQLAAGEDEGATHNLKKLRELYPNEDTIRDLEMRAALRSTFSIADALPIRRGQPGAVLRMLLLFMTMVAVCLTASAGFALAYQEWVIPPREEHEREVYLARLQQSFDQRLKAGDLTGARQVLEELSLALPGDQDVEAAFDLLRYQESLDAMYNSALDREAQSDWRGALDGWRHLEATSPGYRDVRQRIAQIERTIELEEAWQEAVSVVEANDWPRVVTLLTDIRRRAPGFHRDEADEYLFRGYEFLARQLLDGAGGNVGQMEEAIEYLGMALQLRPAQRDLIAERKLARLYVVGAVAYMDEKWGEAAEAWQSVHHARPNYQGGIVDTYLYQAYPRAAEELLEGAMGAKKPIQQAIGYLEQVLMRSPEDPWALEERSLALEYLAGLEAFDKERWNEAIVHWGPIYDVRPSYQSGAIEEKLRVACAATETEFRWCSP